MEKQNLDIPEHLNEFITDGTSFDIRARYASLKEIAAKTDFGVFDDDVVVLDTETTGLSFAHDELIQIAAARVSGGAITSWYTTFVNPGKPIPEDIVHLTGITNDDVCNAPDSAEALNGLVDFVGTSYVVAHNAEFDRTMTTKHPAGYPLLSRVWIDSLDLARIAVPRMKSHRLLDLVRAFDCPVSTHRADDDVAATCAVLRILLAGISVMPKGVVSEIAALASVSEWPTVEVFRVMSGNAPTVTLPDEVFGEENAPSDGMASDLSSSAAAMAGEATEGLEHRHAFSLKTLRKDQLSKATFHEKKDAEAIAAGAGPGLMFPSQDDVSGCFTENGLVGSLYEHYESRAEQVQMAEAVRSAYESSANLVVEAGTGVGKSMAYLVPAVLTAKKNDITVGIATKTNALLDQLVYHELPALSNEMGFVSFAALKGFSHYICLRKSEKLISDGGQMKTIAGKDVSTAPSLAALLSFIEQTPYDDMDSMKIDYRAVPRWSITTTSHDCLRRKCPFFGTSCYVHGARRQAEAADVVVTNHSLLFCDVVADGGLLPPIRYWVIDEAHGAEAEARRAFSLSLDAVEINALAQRLQTDDALRNPFVRAERRLIDPKKPEAAAFLMGLTAKAKARGKSFAHAAFDFTGHMKDLLYFDTHRKGKGYDTVELWLNDGMRKSSHFQDLASYGKVFMEEAEELVRQGQNIVAYLEDMNNAGEIQRDIASITMTIKDMLKAGEAILGPADERYAYSATVSRKKDRVGEKLEALTVNVGNTLADTLYARTHSVVFTSATIAVDGNFDAFESAMGLNAGEGTEAREVCLASSYDFDTQMKVYVATDIPEPNDPAYLKQLQKFLAEVHVAGQGSMLTLFTNRKEMEQCFDTVQPVCKEEGLRVVCQKWGVSTKGLRDDFLKDKSLSLFALKSFWEGFDAPGDTLRGVIVPKLPFSKPTDPLSCERSARDDAAWRKYVLPAAVIEVKQAAGRLIRKADDSGVLILTDRRLVSKGYGKTFLRSLPSNNISCMTCAQIVADIRSRQRAVK